MHFIAHRTLNISQERRTCLFEIGATYQVYDAFMAGWKNRLEYLNRMEAIPPVATFFRACELQERCGGLYLRELLAMPLEVFLSPRRFGRRRVVVVVDVLLLSWTTTYQLSVACFC